MNMALVQRMAVDVFLKPQREALMEMVTDASGRILAFDEKISLLVVKVDELCRAVEMLAAAEEMPVEIDPLPVVEIPEPEKKVEGDKAEGDKAEGDNHGE